MDERELDDVLDELIDDGLVAVTGRYPHLRYCLTPQGQAALGRQRPHLTKRVPWVITPLGLEALAEPRPGFPDEQRVRDEAREIAIQRHAASQPSNVVRGNFGERGA